MMLRQRRKIQLVIVLGLTLGLLARMRHWLPNPGFLVTAAEPIPPAEPALPTQSEITPPSYDRVELPHAMVHMVTIPNPPPPNPPLYRLRVAIAATLEPVGQSAQVQEAIAALNAGFFDPQNGLTTSYGVVQGKLVADPRQNPRLMGNPELTSYLDRILNRSEFRSYDCGNTVQYDITFHDAPVPEGCRLRDAIGAGPQLLPQDTSEIEGFTEKTSEGSLARDALGSQFRNARSAIGLKADGTLVMVMIAQRPGVSSSGMTFPEMIEFLRGLGVEKALNLDGGSSSTLVYEDVPHFGKLDAQGNWVERPVKSILWVGTDDDVTWDD